MRVKVLFFVRPRADLYFVDGVTGFMRCIAGQLHNMDGIRVNAICPGLVKTGLAGEGNYDGFPQDVITPVEEISKRVLQLVDGSNLVDSKGVRVPSEMAYGLAVEISMHNFYIRSQPEYCDDAMARIMGATESDAQKGGVLQA